MQSIQEMRGAGIVMDVCAKVQPGENVLVATDFRASHIAERIAAAARERDCDVTMTVMEPRKHNGNEPPATVAAALKEAEVIFHVTYRSITHTQAASEAKDENTRWLSLIKFEPKDLVEGGLYADFEAMRPYCDEMAQKFSDADEAHITSPQGTDVTVDLRDRAGNSHPGIADEPGTHTGLVHIEANVSPVPDGVNGHVVFDGAIPDLDIGILEDPVEVDIEDGQVVDIEGGKEARRIERVWAEYDNPAVYQIAQLAVGMNPEVPDFTNGFSENHGRFGNVHFGIGTSIILGGENTTPVHFDAMMGEATLALDGEVVLDAGRTFPFIPDHVLE